MKQFVLFLTSMCCLGFVMAQEYGRPVYTHFDKGNSFWGISTTPVYSDMFYTNTSLVLQGDNRTAGLLLAPSYSKMIAKNWMLGGMVFLGYLSDGYTSSTYPPFVGPGPFPINPQPVPVKYIQRSFDWGVMPFTRYYLQLNRRNTFAFFGQAGLPLVSSTSNYKTEYPQSPSLNSSQKYSDFVLKGSLGFGLSVQGRYGIFDTHVSNLGWFLGYHGSLGKNKKQ